MASIEFVRHPLGLIADIGSIRPFDRFHNMSPLVYPALAPIAHIANGVAARFRV